MIRDLVIQNDNKHLAKKSFLFWKSLSSFLWCELVNGCCYYFTLFYYCIQCFIIIPKFSARYVVLNHFFLSNVTEHKIRLGSSACGWPMKPLFTGQCEHFQIFFSVFYCLLKLKYLGATFEISNHFFNILQLWIIFLHNSFDTLTITICQSGRSHSVCNGYLIFEH